MLKIWNICHQKKLVKKTAEHFAGLMDGWMDGWIGWMDGSKSQFQDFLQ